MASKNIPLMVSMSRLAMEVGSYALVKTFWHVGHWNGFSFVCVLMCRLRCSRRTKLDAQIPQLKVACFGGFVAAVLDICGTVSIILKLEYSAVELSCQR
jgi:hypothetical protein